MSQGCDNNIENLPGCTALEGTLVKTCRGTFFINSRIKGEVDTNRYFEAEYLTAHKISHECPIDPERVLFFKNGDKVRFYRKSNDEILFTFLDKKTNDSVLKLPAYDRVPIYYEFPDLNHEKNRRLFNFFKWRGAVSGKGNGNAAANENIERVEILTVLQRLLNLEDDADDARNDLIINFPNIRGWLYFSDIQQNDWFAGSVALGILRKWVRGFFDQTFRPSEAVTFAQLLQIAFKAFEIDFAENSDADWQAPLIAAAEKIPEMIFYPPNKILNRAEALEIIYLIERYALKK
jgi:hypothetical protein